MNVVGRVGSLIFTPFHPFGGAVDVIVVEQQDGTYRSTPWYVRFGKFQGVLKGAEKIVRIAVNGVEASFHMYLDNSGEAYFVREVKTGEDKPNHWVKSSPPQDETQILDNASQDDIDHRNEDGVTNADEHAFSNSCPSGDVSEPGRNQNRDEDANNEQQGCPETSGSNGEATSPRQAEDVSEVSVFAVEENSYLYEFRDDRSLPGNSVAVSSYGAYRYEALDHKQMDTVGDLVSSQSSDSEVVLVSRDGHVLTAPISLCENADDVQLDTTKFHLVPSEASGMTIEQVQGAEGLDVSLRREDIFKSCLALCDLHSHIEDEDLECANPESIVLEGNDGAQDSQENNDKECLPETSSSSLGGFDCVTLKEPVTGGDLILERENGSPALSKEVPASESEVLINESPNSSCENLDRSELQLEEEETNQERAANSKGCIEPEIPESQSETSGGGIKPGTSMGFEISLCGNLLRVGMGVSAAAQAFDAHRISEEEFKISGTSIIENENLIIRWKERYLPWDKAAPIILGMAAFGLDFPAEPKDAIPVEQEETPNSREDAPGISSIPSGRSWRWPIPFRRVKTPPPSNNPSHDEAPVDSETSSQSPQVAPTSSGVNDKPPQKQFLRTNIPIIEQIASLNLKDGQNVVTFSFCTRVLGKQQVDAHIYLWKWNARIVISDVDGTITRSDVLGQFMPLVGKDWTQSGVARLFSAIKENGYHLLFLSARAISQAYLTRSFLLNLKQDGKALPSGPVVISPDGLLPSLYREVIRRAPHEFKIACLEEIRALFPCDYNPFYAGFGNRDTDELSYRKIGIPKGKIFIINPKGEVAINRRIEVKSYTSLHTLVHDMFPPASRAEQEDFNSWNYWKIPLPDID